MERVPLQGFARLRGSLNALVFAAFMLVFAGVLAIGGASVFLVHNMMDKTLAIAEESRNVDFINHLHNKVYALLLAIHHMMVHADSKYSRQASQLIVEIDSGIRDYIRHEIDSPYPEGREEIRLMRRLQDILVSLKALATADSRAPNVAKRHEAGGEASWDRLLDQHACDIEFLIRDINHLHFDIIARKVEKTRRSMSLLFNLLAGCSLAGLALLYMGYRLHSRHVVKPLKGLATAAGQVASGNLGIRVASGSRTEIGQLHAAFNTMVERLQAHEEELLALNRSLEHKVRERTDALETAHADLMRYEKMALLGQIATSVNHEVRTPLNTLSMNMQLIKRLFEDSRAGIAHERRTRQDELLSRIDLVDREVQRVSDMLEEFVRYARLTPPELKEADLNQVLAYVAEIVAEQAKQTGVSLRFSPAEPTPLARVDVNKLTQVLVNLCTNALHAMPSGGELGLTVNSLADQVEVTVADTGMGIPAADMDKIFRPFFTSKDAGLGFGLAIAQRIVEDHGGRISCQSQVGQGTVFTIRLPRLTHASAPGDSHAGS